MSERVDLLATTAFGLEAVAAREIEALGYEARIVSTGRVHFRGDHSAIARANLWLRSADRVLLRVANFRGADFDALFETTKALEWERFIPRDGAFPVNGRSVKSTLSSVPAVQRTVKKAIVERLLAAHHTRELPETGARAIVEIALLEDEATITLDTSGEGLHKRGYRDLVGEAALKETMAAGLVLLSVWRPHRPLVDPFCGTGTIPIEAAMIGLNMAPGARRTFDAEQWAWLDSSVWAQAREEAAGAVRPSLGYTIHGADVNEEALGLARRHAARAGVERHVHFVRREFSKLESKAEYGCIITNPPYGQRLGEQDEIERLYRSFPDVLRRLPTWSHHILTARLDLERLVGQEATRRRKLFNAQIECTYYQFLGPKPPRETTAPAGAELASADEGPGAIGESGENTSAVSPARKPALGPAFGGLRERDVRELEDFEARLAKRARHLRRWPEKGITCYRLYERDCPDVPVVVDRYEDHAHIFEHEREHGRTIAQHSEWLDQVAARTARVLGIPIAQVHVKGRPKQRGERQHEKLADLGPTLVAREGGLRFEVNLTDYADTGLFLDHRITRGIVRDLARGTRFLNLFCYTGAFTVYAAAGGAVQTTSVDLSNTYLEWLERNLALNGLAGRAHSLVRGDALEFLRAHPGGTHYDLAVIDPPTFSNSKRTDEDFIVQDAHVELIMRTASHMATGGVIFFSNNYRRFKLDEGSLHGLRVTDISHRTVPEDFRNERIHRCWRIDVM